MTGKKYEFYLPSLRKENRWVTIYRGLEYNRYDSPKIIKLEFSYINNTGREWTCNIISCASRLLLDFRTYEQEKDINTCKELNKFVGFSPAWQRVDNFTIEDKETNLILEDNIMADQKNKLTYFDYVVLYHDPEVGTSLVKGGNGLWVSKEAATFAITTGLTIDETHEPQNYQVIVRAFLG